MDLTPKVFAFYGSLRKGMPLYEQFKHALNYQFSIWAIGYKLYTLGDFPCAVKSKNKSDRIMIELFEITDESVAEEIDAIEIGYGYYRDRIEADGVEATIYLFESAENYQRVLGGDWVKFFRAR